MRVRANLVFAPPGVSIIFVRQAGENLIRPCHTSNQQSLGEDKWVYDFSYVSGFIYFVEVPASDSGYHGLLKLRVGYCGLHYLREYHFAELIDSEFHRDFAVKTRFFTQTPVIGVAQGCHILHNYTLNTRAASSACEVGASFEAGRGDFQVSAALHETKTAAAAGHKAADKIVDTAAAAAKTAAYALTETDSS